MAKRRKSVEAPKPDTMEMLARLLAIAVVRGLDKDVAVTQLGAVGFNDKTVSELLEVSESSIRGLRFRREKSRKKSKV